ncbi:MAG TPA: hypothetical protein VMJ65_03695 [Solirubrobacteraceae bacterium]|nr:hypothetical protein [Solirubrobacteraceae bacterium]
MQRIRTVLRTSGGRFFYEGQGIEGGDGAVEGAADVGGDELEPDGAEQVAQGLRRPCGALFQDLLDVRQPLLDPLDGRWPEDLLAAAAERVHFVGQVVDPVLGLDQGLGERLAPATLADEVDDVGQPALLGGELGLLELQRVGQVGPQLGDLVFNSVQHVGDVLGISYLLLNGSDDDGLSESPTDERLVVAGALCGGQAAVVAAPLPLTWAMVAPHDPQTMAPASRLGREVRLPAPLLLREPTLAVAAVPRPMHRLPPLPDGVPQLLGNDPQLVVLVDDPLGLRLIEAPPPAGLRIPSALRLVPNPAAGVLLVVEDPSDGGGRPSLG